MVAVLSNLQAEILSRLERSPLGQKIQAEAEADVLGKRRAAAAELVAIDKERLKAMPPLDIKRAEAAAKVREAEAAVKVAQEAQRTAELERQSAAFRFDQREHAQHRILAELAPPCVDAFLTEIEEVIFERERAWRNPIPAQRNTNPPYSPSLDEQAQRKESQRHADEHAARLVAIREARGEAEALRLTGLTTEQLEARFAAMRQAIENAGRGR